MFSKKKSGDGDIDSYVNADHKAMSEYEIERFVKANNIAVDYATWVAEEMATQSDPEALMDTIKKNIGGEHVWRELQHIIKEVDLNEELISGIKDKKHIAALTVIRIASLGVFIKTLRENEEL